MNAPVLPALSEAGSTLVEPVLAVQGLTKAFAGTEILRGVDFALAPGQSTALIGANGSGKSTLLRCLVRLVEPTSGRVRMLGQDVGALAPQALRRFRARVGIVRQKHNLVPRMSALSNVIHGAQARMSGPRVWVQALAPAAVRGPRRWPVWPAWGWPTGRWPGWTACRAGKASASPSRGC